MKRIENLDKDYGKNGYQQRKWYAGWTFFIGSKKYDVIIGYDEDPKYKQFCV